MANKKHQSKKHSFKHAAPTDTHATVKSQGNQASVSKHASTPAARSAAATDTRDFTYVARDLKRILIFASALVTLELALWLAMDYTGLGDFVFNLINI